MIVRLELFISNKHIIDKDLEIIDFKPGQLLERSSTIREAELLQAVVDFKVEHINAILAMGGDYRIDIVIQSWYNNYNVTDADMIAMDVAIRKSKFKKSI